MKKLICIMFALLLCSCMQQENYGKKVVLELEIEQDAAGVIMINPEGFSFSSRDSRSDGKFDAEQIFDLKDLIKLPLNARKAIVDELVSEGISVPQEVVDSITEGEGAAKPKEEQEEATNTDNVTEVKLPLKVVADGPIHISGNWPMKFEAEGICGPDLGSKLKITFPDGRELFVENTKEDVNTTAGRGYRPGCNYTEHEYVTWMEIYDDPGKDSAYIIVEEYPSGS